MFKGNFALVYLLTIISFHSTSCETLSLPGEDRLIGGANAGTANRQHVASIRLLQPQGNFHICGGFIINKHWVGTAAQCLKQQTINNTAVAVGTISQITNTLYALNEIRKHQNFNAATLANDIALVRTTNEIIFEVSTVRPSTLGTQPIMAGLSVSIYGWGQTAAHLPNAASLLSAAFGVLSHENCLANFPFVARRFISDRHICTSVSNRATCPGDAGGPIFFNGAVIGIVSWVEPCVAGQTNVNTRIAPYNNWILGITRADD